LLEALVESGCDTVVLPVVAVLPSVERQCSPSTVNRKLSALSAFYQHAARNGMDLGELLTTWQPAGRWGSGCKPFLHHIGKGQPQSRRTIGLRAPHNLPRVLTVAETQAILEACERLRDRFLFALLWDSGVRIGEALGMRHARHRRRRMRGEDCCAGQRQRRSHEVPGGAVDPDQRRAGPALRRLPAPAPTTIPDYYESTARRSPCRLLYP
jgi:hypothetical protein